MTRLLLLVLLLAACTAQPSASDPGTPGLIGQGRVGAPYGVSSDPDLPPGRRSDGPARRTTPSPAVANVATSEGTDGPADSHAGGTAADVTLEGIASWVAPRYGKSYLAMRLPKGTHVTLSGPGGTWEAVVNDYGPAKRTGRIADIAVGRWEDICGVPRSLGLCRVTAVITNRAAIALPETDQEEP